MKTNSKNSRKNLLQLFGSTFLIMLFLALNTACSKPENGVNGANGANGKDGVAGTNGTNGNANLISSGWKTIVWQPVVGSPIKVTETTASQIDSNALDNAAILVYIKSSTSIIPLPYSYDGNDIIPTIEVGKIKLSTNFSNPTSFDKMRYVIIPSNYARGTTTSQPDYSQMTYSQVCKFLNIPE